MLYPGDGWEETRAKPSCDTGHVAKSVALAKPCTRDLMMFMVFPKESHEQVHVEQKSHAVRVSISLTSWEVIVPFVVRITGKPSSPVAIVKGSTFISGTT